MASKVHMFQGLYQSGGGANLPRVKIISCINRRKGALFGATISHDKVTTLAGSQQHLLIQWYGRGNREVYPRQGSQAVWPLAAAGTHAVCVGKPMARRGSRSEEVLRPLSLLETLAYSCVSPAAMSSCLLGKRRLLTARTR